MRAGGACGSGGIGCSYTPAVDVKPGNPEGVAGCGAGRSVGAGGVGSPILLASGSARRRGLLEAHGIAHERVETGVDDAMLVRGSVSVGAWVVALAHLKARAGLAVWAEGLVDAGESRPGGSGHREGDSGGGGRVVLGADTLCVKEGEPIGQPRDGGHARAILHRLRGGEHEVLTGVALVEGDAAGWVARRVMFLDRSRVRVGWIGDGEVEAYVASGQWAGKAGGYNLTERVEAGWPVEFEGDPTSIVGLPMGRLVEALKGFA